MTAFLHRLTEKHEVSDTEFLVDGSGYLTALARHELSGHLNYSTRNHIEKWFQTVVMRIDRFHSFWRGSPASAERWLRRFRTPLQPRSTESSARWTNAGRGDSQLDSANLSGLDAQYSEREKV